MDMAESVPTVVISLAFCSSAKEKLETADSRGEAIEGRRVEFYRGRVRLFIPISWKP